MNVDLDKGTTIKLCAKDFSDHSSGSSGYHEWNFKIWSSFIGGLVFETICHGWQSNFLRQAKLPRSSYRRPSLVGHRSGHYNNFIFFDTDESVWKKCTKLTVTIAYSFTNAQIQFTPVVDSIWAQLSSGHSWQLNARYPLFQILKLFLGKRTSSLNLSFFQPNIRANLSVQYQHIFP